MVAILILAFFPSSSSFSDHALHTVSPTQMLHVQFSFFNCQCTAALQAGLSAFGLASFLFVAALRRRSFSVSVPDIAKWPEENCGKSLLIHVLFLSGVLAAAPSSLPWYLSRSECIVKVNPRSGPEAVLPWDR